MPKNSKVIPLFQEEEILDLRWLSFGQTELYRIYQSIPWDDLAELLPAPQSSYTSGAKPWFDNAGKFGVMFLKHYTNLSDEKLIQRINTDWAMQLFCGIRLGLHQRIKDKSIVSRIRGELGGHLAKIPAFQKALAKEWLPYLETKDLEKVTADATCYESYLRYPTDVKLLWESVEWLYEQQLFPICCSLKVNRPRNKFKEQQGKQLKYAKRKKKTYKQTRVRLRSLLYLVNKGISQLEFLLEAHPGSYKVFKVKDISTLSTIKKST